MHSCLIWISLNGPHQHVCNCKCRALLWQRESGQWRQNCARSSRVRSWVINSRCFIYIWWDKTSTRYLITPGSTNRDHQRISLNAVKMKEILCPIQPAASRFSFILPLQSLSVKSEQWDWCISPCIKICFIPPQHITDRGHRNPPLAWGGHVTQSLPSEDQKLTDGYTSTENHWSLDGRDKKMPIIFLHFDLLPKTYKIAIKHSTFSKKGFCSVFLCFPPISYI